MILLSKKIIAFLLITIIVFVLIKRFKEKLLLNGKNDYHQSITNLYEHHQNHDNPRASINRKCDAWLKSKSARESYILEQNFVSIEK